MALLVAQPIPVSGVVPTFPSATAGGDQAPIGSRNLLLVRNGGASPITATVVTPGTVKGLPIGDAALTVPAGGSALLPLDSIYRDPVTGRAAITYSAVTSVTVGVIQVG
jgi:hypothetical protein